VLKLWERIEKKWSEFMKETCNNPIESIPRRIEAVLKSKGKMDKVLGCEFIMNK
jgi:hypothetical protein